jgi:hypothetical protein
MSGPAADNARIRPGRRPEALLALLPAKMHAKAMKTKPAPGFSPVLRRVFDRGANFLAEQVRFPKRLRTRGSST